jgi:hypothetical protein
MARVLCGRATVTASSASRSSASPASVTSDPESAADRRAHRQRQRDRKRQAKRPAGDRRHEKCDRKTEPKTGARHSRHDYRIEDRLPAPGRRRAACTCCRILRHTASVETRRNEPPPSHDRNKVNPSVSRSRAVVRRADMQRDHLLKASIRTRIVGRRGEALSGRDTLPESPPWEN